MPVRSLNSAVFKWPKRETVLAAAGRWATELRAGDSRVSHVYCVGSCAREDWGVGSDIDLIVVLSDTDLEPNARYLSYCPENLPVPADVCVYTEAEWKALPAGSPALWRRLSRELLELA